MERLAALSPWLAAWWMAGVLLFNVRHLFGWFSARRLRTAGAVAADDEWRQRLRELAGRIGVFTSVGLRESSRVESPAVLGLLKPVILVPTGMLAASPAAHVELILVHELAHVRRQDYAVNLLRRLVGPGDASARPTPAAALASMALVLALALFGWQSPMTAAPQVPDQMTAHEKLLAFDAVYIIQDREKAAFLELTTDAEHDRFIEQFWERRDPTPGSAANEAMEEHYRRIAYSNSRFATDDGLTGWRTDRGRIYVVHGPPDEIEMHPSGGGPLAAEFGAETPYQMWRYRTDGFHTVYIFVDRNGDGNYELNQRNED